MSVARSTLSSQLSDIETEVQSLRRRLAILETNERFYGGFHQPNDAKYISFRQTGTQLERMVDTKLAENISVKDFGAKGDGVTDDSASIQAAVDYLKAQLSNNIGCVLHFPPGKYLIRTSIDMTNIRTGFYMWKIDASGAFFDLRTNGKPAFDLLSSRHCLWEGGTLIGYSASAITKSAIQIGRAVSGLASDSHCFINLQAIGTYRLTCIHNYASEDLSLIHCALANDYTASEAYCLIQDGTNFFSVSSDYISVAAANTAASFNDNSFFALDARKTQSGPCIWACRTARHSYYNSYLVSYNAPAMILYHDIAASHSQLYLDAHCETSELTSISGITAMVQLQFSAAGMSSIINGLFLRDSNVHAVNAIVDGTSAAAVTILNADFEFNKPTTANSAVLFSPAAVFNAQGDIVINGAASNFNISGMAAFSGIFAYSGEYSIATPTFFLSSSSVPTADFNKGMTFELTSDTN